MGIIASPGMPFIWHLPAPEFAGIAPDLASRLDGAVSRGEYAGLHALLILRNGRPAVERYYPGKDALWGQDLGTVNHGPENLHDIRSVTKTIVGLLYGIALSDGLVPEAAERLIDHFPAYAGLFDDPRKARITIGHVLSMRMGLAWHETTDYDDPLNDETLMERAADRYHHILSRPMADKPGSRWVYCGGATALLGDLIERGTGQDLATYAHNRLFAPLGITETHWVKGADGRPVASSGLRLLPRDLARIGQMVLNRGQWSGRRVVPPGWLATSFKPRGIVESSLRYGYQWWLGSLVANGKPWAAAFGNGGQRLFVIPSLKMVVVILAGNYNAADQWKMPAQLMQRLVIPSVLKD